MQEAQKHKISTTPQRIGVIIIRYQSSDQALELIDPLNLNITHYMVMP